MKAKKLVAGLLAAVMLLSLTGNFALAAGTSDAQTGGYHYDQLDELGKVIYDGIETIDLTTGTAELDLVGNGLDGSALPGSAALNAAMNAARYAYYADHPEVFYVDFPKLTLRITQDREGGKHVTIGSGRNDSYLNSAFADKNAVDAAVKEFNARVDGIVAGAKAVTDPKGESLQAAQIEYVHNEIVKHTSYRLEDTAAEGNAPLLGTPYGVLVKKQGVCEGYARAFKTVMDKLGINCILVQGVHQYDGEAAVSHMWNYVEITDAGSPDAKTAGGRWYAVDATLDDPEVPVTNKIAERDDYLHNFATYGEDRFEQVKYLLAGQLTMNEKHFEAEEVEAAGGYRFAYPALEEYDFTVTEVSNDLDGFKVIKQDVPGAASGETVTEFKFNYLGMNATQAKEKGIYLLWRYYKEEGGEIVPVYNDYGSWYYLDTQAYNLKEEGEYISILEGKSPYVEIAATTVPPEEKPPADRPMANLTYQGDDAGLIARTGKIFNPNITDYAAPPYIVRQTPTQTATITISDRFYHITAEFDEDLVLAKGYTSEADVKTRIVCRDRGGAAVSGDQYSEIKNFGRVGSRTVEFDMKFSLMYADSNVIYNIYLEGLVGQSSGKTPNPITYTTRRKGPCPCIMERDNNWDVFGKPTLLEGEDLSLTNWETASGQKVDQLLSHRLALVTTSTTERQNEQIKEQVEANVKDTIVKSETYNIGLSLCKSMVIKTGSKLKVRLGFPAGYGPNDEGVTFKAYHFTRDSQGNVTGVDPIECVVTQYGLILLCDAFSPFMVAVVEQDPAEAADQSVVVTASEGGTVTCPDASCVVKLKEGESQNVTFTAKAGYQIESVTVCGKEIALTDRDKQTVTVTVSYADVQGVNNTVNADFVAAAVAQKEEKKGQTPVRPAVEAAQITNMPASRAVTEGDTLTIEPAVDEQAGSVQLFQWYKDGVLLKGKTGKKLELTNVTTADAGQYTLKVTTTVGTTSEEAQSSACLVTVAPKSTGGGNTGTGGSTGTGGGSTGTGGSTVTQTVTNPDGSRTTTVTNKSTGTVTETTTYKDGSKLVVETKKDGTKTTTSTAKNGVTVKTVDAPNAAVTASVTIPKDVGTVTVAIPAAATPGMVAVDTATGETVKLSVNTEDGMLVRLDASAQLVLEDRTIQFTDASGHWAKDAIDFATAHNLFAGTGEDSFTPDANMTRAMLMTVLARFDGEDITGGSTWYEKGVAWAVENGVFDGSAPGDDITREALAYSLWRYAGSPAVSDSLEHYPDADSVSKTAADAVCWAVSTGIIYGMGDGTLAPQGSATRAQVAAMLMRFVVNLTTGRVDFLAG